MFQYLYNQTSNNFFETPCRFQNDFAGASFLRLCLIAEVFFFEKILPSVLCLQLMVWFLFSTGLWVEHVPRNVTGIENTIVSIFSMKVSI